MNWNRSNALQLIYFGCWAAEATATVIAKTTTQPIKHLPSVFDEIVFYVQCVWLLMGWQRWLWDSLEIHLAHPSSKASTYMSVACRMPRLNRQTLRLTGMECAWQINEKCNKICIWNYCENYNNKLQKYLAFKMSVVAQVVVVLPALFGKVCWCVWFNCCVLGKYISLSISISIVWFYLIFDQLHIPARNLSSIYFEHQLLFEWKLNFL